MQPTHTPGPWKHEPIPADAYTDPDMQVPDDDLFWVVDEHAACEVVATVGKVSRGDAEANARLLAKAPMMAERLHLITRAALDMIDGDRPSDAHWGEIIGIAEGDPSWLHHAKVNYDVDHARLVTLARKLIEGLVESLPDEGPITEAWKQHEAACLADQLEQEVLPEMFLAEDGRTFLRGQGQAYEIKERSDRRAVERT